MNSVWLQKAYSCFFSILSTLIFSNSLEAAWSVPVNISQANVDSR